MVYRIPNLGSLFLGRDGTFLFSMGIPFTKGTYAIEITSYPGFSGQTNGMFELEVYTPNRVYDLDMFVDSNTNKPKIEFNSWEK
jgi:hypothetical protein